MAVKIKIKAAPGAKLPAKATEQSAGFDLRAYLPEGEITLQSLGRALVPTGLYAAVPPGYSLDIRARSGLSVKAGITVINGVGTVDADYRGEIMVPLVNLSQDSYTIKNGDRIAQALLNELTETVFEEVSELDTTERGCGGFGSTGA
jgi:dUTP pyrophosphatase